MSYFVSKDSIVRRIWGKSDTILFIFAGAAAEFALNKAVDWLYFTGRIPADPIGRLFSTVSYARAIIFSEKEAALRAIDAMTAIHGDVEAKRAQRIPDWAYRDVLFMLIDYSIRAFEVLERKLTSAEKHEIFDVFHRMATRMNVGGLPETFDEWAVMRQSHLMKDLQYSQYTEDLFGQYRKHLGALRYRILIETQILVAPSRVREWLGYRKISMLNPIIAIYKLSRRLRLDWVMKELVLPTGYKRQIRALDSI